MQEGRVKNWLGPDNPGDIIEVDVWVTGMWDDTNKRFIEIYKGKEKLPVIGSRVFKNSGINFPCGSSGPFVRRKGRDHLVHSDRSIVVRKWEL